MIESPYRWEQPLNGASRWLVWLLAAGLVAALVWAAFAKVRVYALVQGTLAPRSQPVQVNAPAAGRVIGTRVQLWQKVKKGDVLYTVDTLARDPQDAQLQMQMSQNSSSEAQAAIVSAQAEYDARLSEEKGARQIYAVGGLPRASLDAAVLTTRQARAKLLQAQAQAGTAQTQIQVLNRNQRVKVLAPIDGQVMQLADIHTGQMLGAGQGSVQILPEGVPFVFRATAAESDRPKLRDGARVQIAWNGYPRQKYGVTVGTLTGVSPTSTAPTSTAAGATTAAATLGPPRYEIEVSLPNADAPHLGDKPLLPGMMGEAHVQSNERTVLNLFVDWVRGADPWN